MRIVIIGAGHAAGQLAAELMRLTDDVHITLIGQENHPPYQRPPLSKAYLSDDMAVERLYLRPVSFYEKAGIELKLGSPALALNRRDKHVLLSNGEQVFYDRLVLATGGIPRRLKIPGAHLSGQYVVRSIHDVDALRPALIRSRKIAIIGGGYIGLEVAAVARKMGVDVHVIEQEPRLLARVASPNISAFFERLHGQEGVHVHLDTTVSAFCGGERIERVALSNGHEVGVDLVVTGIGIDPDVALAKAADLVCDNGVLVDEFLTSSDEDILAIGDCANAMNLFLGRWARVESVQNAVDQALVAAQVLTGNKHPYRAIPWLWSDQYDVKFQSVGLGPHHDEMAVRGNMHEGRSFSIFYLKSGAVVAVNCVNRLKDFMVAKKLVAAGKVIPAATLSDENTELKTWLN